MLSMQTFLKIIFILCFFGALFMGVASKASAYRVLAVVALGALAIGVTFEYGLLGLLVVTVIVGIVIPVAVLVASRTIVWLTWQNVRKQFPAEPRQPPCERLTLTGAYRIMWLG
ncbi:hypothetical protein [Azotobacter beijerinckii]|uniref:Uncharacterized protein n=1 Tax=Azotobacter beijerinckii TaxID=170623 RepID=A0A1I4I187_9GAMM|nr:hypothetical protein [Azotobacter beijerinckii]SFL48185.1 hypothetical protein SAMN04244574_04443 [Azotobacter beijerinckii]